MNRTAPSRPCDEVRRARAASRRRAWLAAVLIAVAGLPGALAQEAVPEPNGFRLSDYRAPTPATLAGARVIDTTAAAQLWREGAAVFIDVMPRPPKPANLPAGTIWRDVRRDSVPGSVWLPNVGYGALSDQAERYFRDSLEAITGGDRSRLVVFYCEAECWMSWNAAKRAVMAGYASVAWFPDGTDGWRAAALPLAEAPPWGR